MRALLACSWRHGATGGQGLGTGALQRLLCGAAWPGDGTGLCRLHTGNTSEDGGSSLHRSLAAGLLGVRSVAVVSGPAGVSWGSAALVQPTGPFSGQRQLSAVADGERQSDGPVAKEEAMSFVAHIQSSCDSFDARTSAAVLTRLGFLIREGILSEQEARPALAGLWTARKTLESRRWLQTQIQQAVSRSQLSGLVETSAGALDGCGVTLWLQRLAGLGPGPGLSDSQLQTVLRHILRHSSRYSADQISRCALALAQMSDLCDHQQLHRLAVEMLEMQVTVRAREFAAGDLVNVVGSLVELGANSRLMLSTAASAARPLSAGGGDPSATACTCQALKLLSAACELESSADLESRAMQLLSFMAIFKERMLMNRAEEINKCLSATSTLEELTTVVSDRHHVFDAINTSTALHKLAATGHKSVVSGGTHHNSEPLQTLLNHMESKASGLRPRTVANTVHALARMGVTSGPVWSLLQDSLLSRASSLLHTELASAAWAMARSRCTRTDIWSELRAEARRHASSHSMSARSAATLMWAFATAEAATPELLSLLCAEVARSRHEAAPQELSMAFWALAKSHVTPDTMPSLVEAAVLHMAPRGGQPLQTYQESKHFTAQGLATTVWAMASLGVELPDSMLPRLEHCALEIIDDFTPQGAAMLLWGLSSSGAKAVMQCESVFQSLSQPMTEAAAVCGPADVAMLLYAYAIAGVERGALFGALSRRLSEHLAAASIDPVNMAMSAWALAALGHDAPDVFSAMALNVSTLKSLSGEPHPEHGRSAQCGTPRAVALVSWACATLGYNFPQVFTLTKEVLKADTMGFNAQGLANTLWAMAVVDELDSATLRIVREQLPSFSFSKEGLRQLYLVELSLLGWQWQDTETSQRNSDGTWLPESLHAQARQAWLELDSLDNSQSREQYAQLADLIRSLGIDCEVGTATEDNELLIHVACRPREADKVAIDIYWRSSCSSTHPFRPLGKALFRKRLLEARGWRVVGLTSDEWHSAPDDHYLAQEWLQERLGISPTQDPLQPNTSREYHPIPSST